MKLFEHPEVADIKNICEISSQTQYTSDVCEKIKANKVISLKTEVKRLKNEKELDETLQETFPASDAVAKY